MKLSAAGHPLHTRSLTISMQLCEDGAVAIDAAVIDLRKCGFVPVAGFLQTAGIVHHMTLEAMLDPETRILDRFVGAQPTRPFQPCALTGGECCSDPLPALERLAGHRLDASFVPALRRVFGGPRGCSHLLALAQLVASTVPYALDRIVETPERRHRVGERFFHRAVEIDGYDLGGDLQQVVVQLTDLHFAPTSEVATPMAHFGRQTEIQLSGQVDLSRNMALGEVEVFERKRTYEEVEDAVFVDRSGELAFLEGQGVMGGMGRRVLEAFGDDPEDNPLLDALLMLAPGFLQCLASLSERWPGRAKRQGSLLGITGQPDSCWMWRNDGPVMQSADEGRHDPGEGAGD